MRLLRKPRPAAVDRFYRYMVKSVHTEPFTSDLDPKHLEPIDYETIFDMTHDMPLIAVFSDGSREELRLDRRSMTALHDKLKTLNVIQVLYLPPALEKIRYVLKEACLRVQESNCESYDDYIGLMENRARVFSRAEEQVIKWATIYQTPIYLSARMFRKNSNSQAELTARIEMQRNLRLVTSAALLKGVFSEGNAAKIFQLFASGYINDAYDRLTNMTSENVVILPPR